MRHTAPRTISRLVSAAPRDSTRRLKPVRSSCGSRPLSKSPSSTPSLSLAARGQGQRRDARRRGPRAGGQHGVQIRRGVNADIVLPQHGSAQGEEQSQRRVWVFACACVCSKPAAPHPTRPGHLAAPKRRCSAACREMPASARSAAPWQRPLAQRTACRVMPSSARSLAQLGCCSEGVA